ncbi:hypothetical protein MTO96_021614 [Rhipicephalus appendiculatus]
MAHQRTPQPKKRSSNPPQTSRRSLPTQEQSPSYEGRPSHAEPVAYYSQPVGYYLPYPAMAPGDQPPVRSPTPVDGTKGGTVSTQPAALHSLFKPPPDASLPGPATHLSWTGVSERLSGDRPSLPAAGCHTPAESKHSAT